MTIWTLKSCFGTFFVLAPDPDVVTIPPELIRRAWLERLFNVNVTVYRFRNGKQDVVFNWPARKLKGKN